MEYEGQSKVLEKVKELMSVQGYSQPKLAELAGISFQSLNNYFAGRSPLTDKAAEKILSVFGLSIFEVLEDEYPVLNRAVRGYLEYNGEIKRINSFKDAENFVKKYQEEVIELPKMVKADAALDAKNRRIATKNKVEKWDIVLDRVDTYDCSKVDVWAFRKTDDEREDITLALGNMCPGFDFEMDGQHFYGSEQAYICGLFSNDDPKHIQIQQALINETKGYDSKKKIRQKNEVLKRDDWESFNIEWMKYVVWSKVKNNQKFRDLLLSVPKNAYIVENSTHQTGKTAAIWGAKNQELEAARDRAVKYQSLKSKGKVKKDEENAIRNSLNYLGVYEGKNLMGKILKLCQLALLEGKELDIDYELLRKKNIYLLGNLLTFEGLPKKSTPKADEVHFLLGTITGDMIGKPYERHKNSIKTTDFPLFGQRSRYTDDSVLTIAVMDWLLNDKNLTWEYLADRFVHYGTRYRFKGRDRCYSDSFTEWLKDDNRPFGRVSWSNGAAMRVSPCGWFFNTLEEVEKAAEIQASLTHNHPIAINGAKAAAAAVFLARTGKSKQEIKAFMIDRYGFDLSQSIEKYRERYEWTWDCMKTTEGALMSFLCSDDFESAIRNAVALGGDADTIGAITGSIAEAFYGGVPEHIKDEVLRRSIPDEFKDILSRFSSAIQREEHSVSTLSFKAVIFDMDGTLIDTSILEELTEKIRSCKDENEKKRLWKELYELIPNCKRYDGMEETIKSLIAKGIKVCIVSGSAQQKIDKVVSHFGIPINKEFRFGRYALGRSWHPKLKPDPQPFINAIEKMGVKPGEAIALGNIADDIVGARNAGIKSAACIWGAEPSKEELLKSNPDYVLEAPNDLLSIVSHQQK